MKLKLIFITLNLVNAYRLVITVFDNHASPDKNYYTSREDSVPNSFIRAIPKPT